MIGIIGGTGLEKSNILRNPKKVKVETQYGDPSSEILTGEIKGKKVAIISRHGSEHTITPTNVNNRANITALKQIGCECIIATTACGSLQEYVKPGDFVLADQFIDFTKHRVSTFYDEFNPGEMQHCPMAEPYNSELCDLISKAAEDIDVEIHKKGTIVTIEGPRFSTKAESNCFNSR